MKYTHTLDIHAPMEKVFDLIHDPEKHKLWLQGVEETRYLGEYDPANPVGTKFKQKILMVAGNRECPVFVLPGSLPA